MNIEEFNSLCSSPNIIVTKYKETGWTGHLSHMGEMKRRDHIEDLDVDRRIINLLKFVNGSIFFRLLLTKIIHQNFLPLLVYRNIRI
jgi:hypothetical protein